MGSIERKIIKRFINNIFKEQTPQKDEVKQPDRSYREILQEEGIRKDGETFETWESRYLDLMLKTLPNISNPIDRHFLYGHILSMIYKKRNDNRMRMLYKRIATENISEFEIITGSLQREFRRVRRKYHRPTRDSTFERLAMMYAEDGEYDNAIAICEKAITYGLEDGTKHGFQGRIDRIRKKGELQKD
jgi:hypothetical protein